jgi:hypothetical protein
LLAAVHAQPVGIVTLLLPVPAEAVNDWLVGEIEAVQLAAACVTVNVAPAIVNVPVRIDAAGFAAMSNVTEPLPDPVAPPVTVIHAALLAAVHAQPVAAVTLLLPLPPAALADCVVGEIDGEHAAAACVTVNVTPAIVSVPVRVEATAFAATLKPAVPLPEPVAPLVTVIHAALLAAVHGQPVGIVTSLLPVPAAAVKDWLAGEIDAVQLAAACVTVKLAPAIVSVPVRLDAAGFAATSNVTEPLPDPVAPPVSVIHAALLAAVHAQPVAAVTLLAPLPAAAVKDWLAGEIDGEQAAAAWVTVKVAPAIVSVPVRIDATVLAATLNPTVPLPDPVAPLVTVIQAALLAAVHAQPVGIVTVLLPVPAAAVNDWLVGEIEAVQLAAAWVTLNVAPAIVRVPVRIDAAGFAATSKVTEPLPDPVAPAVTVIQAALLAAVHAHPVAAVTVLLPVPADAVNDWLAGEIEGEQLAAACVTVKVIPAIVRVPVRLEATVFAATVKPTVPLPDPVAPLVSVIQGELLAAVHAQPVATVTLLVPVPPDSANDWPVADSDGEQDAAACVTVNVAPAIVSVPVRIDATVFAATSNVTVPLPDPVAPAVTVIQGALLVALHAQPVAAVTVLLPLAAPAVKDSAFGAIDGEHGAAACVTVNVEPAIVRVPVRLDATVFAATSNVTEPLPDPAAPPVTVIHGALLAAVQLHPVATNTLLPPLPAVAVKDCVVGEIDGEQVAAAWVTVNVEPAIVSVPVRLDATVFVATSNVTGPLPDPVAPPVTVIHGALLVAVQLQPVATATALPPLPAAAVND